ncbi:MAG TPA: AmmeMemoRadiSam system protein B [Planctomycetota bacterium]|nr:AmmeMemoRadiSam system protein B [Planctomycetota bacterium]
MSVRSPSVAGTFYPGRAEELRRAVDSTLPTVPKERALAVVVPHAGYVYSGKVAGAVYGRIEIPRDVVILGFNHRGFGSDFGVWREGGWITPLGQAPVHTELADAIKGAFLPADFDETGHLEEHSGEVQIPFLQRLRPDLRIVPVALSVGLDERSFRQLLAFGQALAGLREEFLVVASTDLNHYESQEVTLRKDKAVIAAIEALDPEALRHTLSELGVSMCGYAPTIAGVAYARAKGATRARTVLHATSGEVSGDYDRVVGYVGMIIPCGN